MAHIVIGPDVIFLNKNIDIVFAIMFGKMTDIASEEVKVYFFIEYWL